VCVSRGCTVAVGAGVAGITALKLGSIPHGVNAFGWMRGAGLWLCLSGAVAGAMLRVLASRLRLIPTRVT